MPVDPQIVSILAQAPEWPGVRGMDPALLRQGVRDSSITIPPAEDTVVARTEDRSIAGPLGNLPLRLYWPLGDGPFPVTIYMHGGGYVTGDLDTQDMIARALSCWGETLVVSVDYALAPEHKFPAGPGRQSMPARSAAIRRVWRWLATVLAAIWPAPWRCGRAMPGDRRCGRRSTSMVHAIIPAKIARPRMSLPMARS